MVKKVSLDVPDEVYEQLSSLSDFFNQDIKQTVASVLRAVGSEQRRIIDLSSWSGLPSDLERTLYETFWTSIHSFGLFNCILRKLKAEAQFRIEDFDFNLEKNYFMFLYAARSDSLYNIYSFDVTKEDGQASLSTNTGIYVKETSQKSLDKLQEVVSDIADPFDLEEFSIEIENDSKEMWTIRINCWAESLDCLPTIKQMSRLVKQIIKKAGIKPKK